MSPRKSNFQADIDLARRLKQRRAPLRPKTYREQSLEKQRKKEALLAEERLRRASEKFRPPETKQTVLGGSE